MQKSHQDVAPITCEIYGVTPQGEEVEIFTLRNRAQGVLKVITYGGIVTRHITMNNGLLFAR